MTLKIDQKPATVTMDLTRGDDLTPIVLTFKAVDFSAYTWSAVLLSSVGATLKTLTTAAAYEGTDTILTISGLTAAESTALPSSGITWRLKTTAPAARTYMQGGVMI